ncbi:MAG: glutamyl-tRNA reductase [Coriobacteriia bacterium]|nr:glutamyl-tRNA reductase [Coriobacteriia bacterium]
MAEASPPVTSPVASVTPYLYHHTGTQALKHLYRVVAGLDSLVLGETEILGQVARAYDTALQAQATDRTLNVWFQRALALGKQVRSSAGGNGAGGNGGGAGGSSAGGNGSGPNAGPSATPTADINQFHTSVGRIAVDLAEQELGDLTGRQILILGAGEMCELTMKHLIKRAASLCMVSNRSLGKAQELAARYGFDACSLDDLQSCLNTADLVFSATSSQHCLVTRQQLEPIMQARRDRPIVFIDMAVPRDIDPQVAGLLGVRCFDIKQIREVSEKNRALREQAAAAIESLIDEKIAELISSLAAPQLREAAS